MTSLLYDKYMSIRPNSRLKIGTDTNINAQCPRNEISKVGTDSKVRSSFEKKYRVGAHLKKKYWLGYTEWENTSCEGREE